MGLVLYILAIADAYDLQWASAAQNMQTRPAPLPPTPKGWRCPALSRWPDFTRLGTAPPASAIGVSGAGEDVLQADPGPVDVCQTSSRWADCSSSTVPSPRVNSPSIAVRPLCTQVRLRADQRSGSVTTTASSVMPITEPVPKTAI